MTSTQLAVYEITRPAANKPGLHRAVLFGDQVFEFGQAGVVSPYNLLTNNCEHFSREVVLGTSQSPQIAVLFLACLGLWLVATRAS